MHKLTLLLFALLPVFCYSQSSNKEKEKSLYAKATAYIEEEQYEFAERDFKQLLVLDSTNFTYWYELGLLYSQQMQNTPNSIPCFKGAMRHMGNESDKNVYLYLAQALQFVQEYDDAIALYKEYEKLPLSMNQIKVSVEKYIQLCEYAKNEEIRMKRKSAYTIVNLGLSINSHYSEYACVPLFRNNKLLFTSRRTSVTDSLMMIFDQYYEYMYISEKKDGNLNENKGTFTKSVNFTSFPEYVNFGKKAQFHKAVIGIYPDYSKLLVYLKQQIWTSTNKDGIWQKPVKMPKAINFAEYMRHATITADGKTMYVSASLSGEADNIDIYVSHLGDDGKWSKAENLGPVINTPGNEDSPEISPDGKTLYFSSAGLSGMGNFDVFRSELDSGEWSTPVNLGYPVNSPADDIFFKVDPNTGVAYFSSSRAEGYGKMDIYSAFPLDTTPVFTKGTTNKADINKYLDYVWMIADTIEAGTKVDLFAKATRTVSVSDISYFWLVDETTRHDGQKAEHIFVNPGKHNVTLLIRAWNDKTEEQLSFIIEKSVVVITREEMTVLKNDAKKAPELKPVFFDYDKSNVRESEIAPMKENIEYLKANPDVKIKIYAYTDSRGSDLYNKKLSQRRVDAVVKYLMKNGIAKKRIIEAYGMGESKLFNKCADGVECTEEMHQENRRAVIIPELNK